MHVFFIRPCLEYSPHIWGAYSLIYIIDRVELKPFRLINDPVLTSTLDPLSLRHKVARLSLIYRYYFGPCSDELVGCMPSPLQRPHGNLHAASSHRFCVEICKPRIDRCGDCFFYSASLLWKSLSASVFHNSYNLSTLEKQVNRSLRN